MRLFSKKLKTTQDEKTFAEARELATHRLEQYIAERHIASAAKDLLGPAKKSANPLTRLRWWW
jgi:hypothetical protein